MHKQFNIPFIMYSFSSEPGRFRALKRLVSSDSAWGARSSLVNLHYKMYMKRGDINVHAYDKTKD